MTKWKAVLLALVAATPAAAQELSISCRCVSGGVNAELADWIKESVIPGFEAAREGVTVTLNEFAGGDEQLTQQLALDFSTGAGADVAGFDGFLIPNFVEGGLLKPLEELVGEQVNDWEGWEHISEGSRALMSYDGGTYGIALGTDVRMIFVRTDLLGQAGIDPATFQPTSWEELLDAARQIKQAVPDSYPLQLNAGVPMGEATTMQGYWMAILGTGEGVVDDQGRYIVESQGILDVLNLYRTIYVDEDLGDARAQQLGDGRNRTFANFRDGKTAMLVEGDWFYRSVTAPGSEFEVPNRDEVMTWAKMPAREPGAGWNGQDFVTISGGTGWVVNPSTEDPALAWELLTYMNSKEQLDAFEGYQPRISIRDDVEVPDNPFLSETAAELLPITTARPNDANYNAVSAEIQRMTEGVISGELTPEEAMARYEDAVIGIVGEENTVSLM